MNKAIKLKKEIFWAWLAKGSPEVADRYWVATGAAALAVSVAKTRVVEETGKAMEKDFQLASRKLMNY